MLSQFLNVLTSGAILYVVAAGLFVIFGIMDIVNFAHGAFLLVGAYSALVVSSADWSPWLALVIAPMVGLVLGLVIEVTIVRRLYARPLDTILATWGLSIIVTQIVMLQFGRGVQYVDAPLYGAVDIGNTSYSKYRLIILGLAVLVGVCLYALKRATDWGLIARAVIVNQELARAMGIDIGRVRLVTFGLGAALAAFGGAVLVPIISVDPNLGLPWLVSAFMIVLVAGVSLAGFATAAVLLGGSQVLVSYYVSPLVGSLVIVLIAATLLRVAPFGLARLSLPSFFARAWR